MYNRCSQLNQLLEGKTEELAAEEEERDLDKKRHEEEIRDLQKCLSDTECQKRNLRDSNNKLLKQLGQMRKRWAHCCVAHPIIHPFIECYPGGDHN